jgi:hypothetical protein
VAAAATRVVTGPADRTWREIQPWPSYAERAAVYLRRHGLQSIPVVARQPARPRTSVRAWRARRARLAARPGIAREDVDLFSAGVRGVRSSSTGSRSVTSKIGISPPRAALRLGTLVGAGEGAKAVLGALLGLAWTKCATARAIVVAAWARRAEASA